MNGLQRIIAAKNFEETDQIPVIPQIFGHAAVLSGVPLGEYVTDGNILARCQIRALEEYGGDAVFAVMDVNVETEAAGSVLEYRKNLYPYIQKFVVSEPDDFIALPVPEPERAGRMPEMLKAIRLLKKNLKDEVLIVGCVMGPFTLVTQLLGLEKTLYLAIDNIERLIEYLDFALEVEIRFGIAQIIAGAHLPIVFDPAASPAVVPPQFFREFILPVLKKLFNAYKEAGVLANWLHITGPVDPILRYYPAAGADIANIDYYVAPDAARKLLPGTCLDGNIKSLSFVESVPEEIYNESISLIKSLNSQRGFILSSGCEIPLEAKPENIAAMINAARNWR